MKAYRTVIGLFFFGLMSMTLGTSVQAQSVSIPAGLIESLIKKEGQKNESCHQEPKLNTDQARAKELLGKITSGKELDTEEWNFLAKHTNAFRAPRQHCGDYAGMGGCTNKPGGLKGLESCGCQPKWDEEKCVWYEDNENCKRKCCKDMCKCIHHRPQDSKCP